MRLRFLGPRALTERLVEQIYEDGGLTWCSRHDVVEEGRRVAPRPPNHHAQRAVAALAGRMRIAFSTGITVILPSPILPVRAASQSASVAFSTSSPARLFRS